MAIVLPSGFIITNTDPVDSRLSLANQAARLALSTANVYKGLVVFQQDTNELYVLINAAAPSSTASWQLVGSNTATGSFATTGSNTFIGNQVISGSLTVTGSITGSLLGTASYAVTSSLPLRGIITASASNTTITFTKGDGTTFDITVSQSGSVATASYALFALTASYVATASLAINSITASYINPNNVSLFQITTGSITASVNVDTSLSLIHI
jgi:hypothetical protein